MDITEILKRAQKSVEDANVSDDLKEIAFAKAIEILSERGTPKAPVKSTTAVDRYQPITQPVGEINSASSELEPIAERLNLPVSVVGEVYSLKNGVLMYNFVSARLAKSKSAGAKQITLVVTAGRQALEQEEWTSFGPIKDCADYYGKLDPANFSAAVQDREMQEWFKFTGGKRSRELQLRHAGWIAAKEVVRELAGGTDLASEIE